MARKPLRILGDVVGLRPGEFRRTATMFSLLGLIIATSYILKPVRSSIFLTEFGADRLPYVYILIGGVLGFVATGFSRIVARFSLNRVFTGAALFFALNLLLFWWALGQGWRYTSYVFYVWVSIFTIVMPTLFWFLANYIFYPNEGRRLFSTVTAGGLLGSIAGGGLTSVLVRVIGTPALLLCAAAVLLLIAALSARIYSSERDRVSERVSDLHHRETRLLAEQGQGVLKLVLGSRYLLYITVLTAVISITSTLVDYQFNVMAERYFEGMDSLTRFFGTFFAAINTVAFFSQLLLAGRVLNRFGVGVGLFFLPIGLFLGSFWSLWMPILASASFLKLSDDGFSNSVNKSSLEILYLPIPMEVKNRTKAWLDMFVERVSRGVAGVVILVATIVFALSVSHISLLVLALVIPWLYLTFLLKREYVKTFRSSLARRDIDVAALTSDVQDQHSLLVLHQVLTGADEKQTLYALELLNGTEDASLLEPVVQLTGHESSDVRAAAVKLLCSYPDPPRFERLNELLTDPNPTVRAEALALLFKTDNVRGKNELNALFQSGDVATTHAVLDCMAVSPELLAGVLDESFAVRYHDSGNARERELAARALGFMKSNDRIHTMLLDLLEDPSAEVARAAADSAGRLRDKRFLPLLIKQLCRRRLRAPARKALARFGDEVVDIAADLLEDDSQHLELRRALPRVLAQFESQEAVDRMVAGLPEDDLTIQYQIIKSLGKIRDRFPRLQFSKSEIERVLQAEAETYSIHASRLAALARADLKNDAMTLLKRALQERFEFTRDRIFRLLGLIYPAKDIYNSWNGVVNGRPPVRAAALEFLGNLLSQTHKDEILPLLEVSAPENVPATGQRLIDRSSLTLNRVLRELVKGKDGWLAACAITLVGKLRLDELATVVKSVDTSGHPVTKEAVEHTLRLLSQQTA
jgi:AAA family ATP:ADP antiporter